MDQQREKLWPGEAWLMLAVVFVAASLGAARFVHIDADPPRRGVAWDGGAFMGDEGMWYKNAIWQVTRGRWCPEGAYNPIVVTPVMPVTAVAVWQATGGVSRPGIRAVTAGMVLVAILALGLAVKARGGRWTAVFVVLLLSSSCTLFAYSRLALMDAPASALMAVAWALTLGWRGGRPGYATVAAAVLATLAVLTKSTMLMAVPALLVASTLAPDTGGRRWRGPVVMTLIGGVLLALYGVVILTFHRQELTTFLEFNVARAGAGLGAASYGTLKLLPAAGQWLFALWAICLPVALWRMRRHAAFPWVISGLLWMILIGAAVIWKGNLVPRYMVPMIWPMAMIVAVVLGDLFSVKRRQASGLLALGLVLMFAVNGAVWMSREIRSADFTYRDMGREVRKDVDARGGPDEVALVGGWPAGGVGLVSGVPVVGYRTSGVDFESILNRERLAFYVTWGDDDFLGEHQRQAIAARYRRGDPIKYPVLATHDLVNKSIRLTPLLPRQAARE
ncbi:MAG: hypothetical protein GVY24_01910 [Planctomycetes bacterium]|jgi:hypothetical protein|nr:hypothetical protein [Planctomycetota bacterium]